MTDTPARSYRFGPFRLDVAERMLVRDGHAVPLTPKVFDLLEILVRQHGHLAEKEALISAVWPDSFVEEGALTRCVSVLRKALGDEDGTYIETVPKRGYRFIAEVDEVQSPEALPPSRSTSTHPWRAAAWAASMLLAVAALVYAVRSTVTPGPPRDVAAPVHRQLTFTGTEGTPTLSPDGGHIAYVSYESPERHVIVREREDGEPVVVFSAPEAGSLRWSPDGTMLMFWARGAGKDGLYFARPSGNGAFKLWPGPAVAAFSPDGGTIAIGRPIVGRISFRNRQGVEQREISLTNVRRWIADIDWSAANGLLLVVTNDERGRHYIWTIRADGTGQTQIHADAAEISAARWTRDGRAVYFHRRTGQTASVNKLALGDDWTRKAPVVLVNGLETDGSIGISSDADYLVYARAPFSSSLWIVDGLGSGKLNTRALTDGTWRAERPRFSPDGQRIAFTVGHEGRANLYTVPVDGGTPVQLTSLDGFNGAAVWSGDSQSVAFVSTAGGRPEVWAVPAAGGSPTRVSQVPVSDSFQLAWTPAGDILMHQPGNQNFLAVDRANGSIRHFLGDRSTGWIFSPVFSPDGQRVAVAWNRRIQQRGLWLADTRTGQQTLVLKEMLPFPIGWSPDGRSIYVLDGKRHINRDQAVEGGETLTGATVSRVSLDGRIEPVADLPFDEVGGVAISPDGRRIVCSVYSTRSDVWLVEQFDR